MKIVFKDTDFAAEKKAIENMEFPKVVDILAEEVDRILRDPKTEKRCLSVIGQEFIAVGTIPKSVGEFDKDFTDSSRIDACRVLNAAYSRVGTKVGLYDIIPTGDKVSIVYFVTQDL